MSIQIPVPEEFADLGYSGLFWKWAVLPPSFRGPLPSLIGNTGWLALRREDLVIGSRVQLVRQDMAAIIDLFT